MIFMSQARLAPVRQTILNARVAGEIKAIAVREGQSVSAGQVLLTQDDRDLTARLQQAQASLVHRVKRKRL
jgi:multidrug efflux pump subunit AcrA (membrane-fusion protein)